MDPAIEQASLKFISDDDFVESRAFVQFLCKTNIAIFEAKCNKLKAENP